MWSAPRHPPNETVGLYARGVEWYHNGHAGATEAKKKELLLQPSAYYAKTSAHSWGGTVRGSPRRCRRLARPPATTPTPTRAGPPGTPLNLSSKDTLARLLPLA
jgi:hypothetical protein